MVTSRGVGRGGGGLEFGFKDLISLNVICSRMSWNTMNCKKNTVNPVSKNFPF